MADLVDFNSPVHPVRHLTQNGSIPSDSRRVMAKKQRPPVIELKVLTTPVEPEGSFRSRRDSRNSPTFNENPPINSNGSVKNFEESTEYLVREFLTYRLQQSECSDVSGLLSGRNFSNNLNGTSSSLRKSAQRIESSHTANNVEKISKALQLLGDHLDTRYWQAFQQTIPADWFEIRNTADVKHKFFALSRDLYFNVDNRGNLPMTPSEQRVKWGRIIAHFCFTSQLACVAASSNHQELIPKLAAWLTQFITRYLRAWIERNGGWEGLISYQETLTLPKKWSNSSRNCVYGVVAITALGLFGLILSKKFLPSRF